MQGCEVGAIFTSVNTLIPAAQRTGRLTLRSGALVREIEVDRQRAAPPPSTSSIAAPARPTPCGPRWSSSRAAPSSRRACCSTRSRPAFPTASPTATTWSAATSTATRSSRCTATASSLVGRASVNDDGATDHATIARFNHLRGKRDYVGGFMAQLQYADPVYPHHASRVRGFGAAFKRRVRDLQPALMQLGGFGKVVARPDNRVTVDPARTDRHGIPIPVVHFSYGDNDRALWRDMSGALEEIYEQGRDRAVLQGRAHERLRQPRGGHVPHGRGPAPRRCSRRSTRPTKCRTCLSSTAARL